MRSPDFYLASSEGYNFRLPRKCFIVKSVKSEYSDSSLLIDFEPPVDLSKYYVSSFSSLTRLLLSPRHKENLLDTLNDFPISVFVIAVTEDTHDPCFIKLEHQELIAWGEIYKTYEEAFSGTANTSAKP